MRICIVLGFSLAVVGCGESASKANGNGSGGAPTAGSAGLAGGGSTSTGGGGVGGLAENPPHEVLEGVWRAFRRSVMGPCGVEPATWMEDGVHIRLSWAGSYVQTFNCSNATTCTEAPTAYGNFYWTDGQWIATFQPNLQDGTCQRNLEYLTLSADGVLRVTRNENRLDQPCGPVPNSAFTCENEWISEHRRAQ